MTREAVSALRTNKTKDSLVKVVVESDQGSWVTPERGAIFTIDEFGRMPAIRFEVETSLAGPFKWSWSITWEAKASGLREAARRGAVLRTFTERGDFQTVDKFWDVNLGKVLGGRLRVQVSVGNQIFKRFVDIRGTNPAAGDVVAYVATLADCDGLDRLLEQESRSRHFISADGQPIVAFDGGYGMAQLTNPQPTYEQAWNWKENVRAGAVLYQAKQRSAKSFLSQKGRTYTSDQLRLETWTRWNGGSYHVWNAQARAWERTPNILCDSQTGNIGWDVRVEDNKDKLEAELHQRDRGTYANPGRDKKDENKWKYTGVCYADHVDSH